MDEEEPDPELVRKLVRIFLDIIDITGRVLGIGSACLLAWAAFPRLGHWAPVVATICALGAAASVTTFALRAELRREELREKLRDNVQGPADD